jgi:hypothetical protein
MRILRHRSISWLQTLEGSLRAQSSIAIPDRSTKTECRRRADLRELFPRLIALGRAAKSSGAYSPRFVDRESMDGSIDPKSGLIPVLERGVDSALAPVTVSVLFSEAQTQHLGPDRRIWRRPSLLLGGGGSPGLGGKAAPAPELPGIALRVPTPDASGPVSKGVGIEKWE